MLVELGFLGSHFQEVKKLVETTPIHKAAGGLFSPDPGLMLWTWLVFFILLAVLYRFAWKPILKSLDEREERISKSLEDASRIEKEIEDISKRSEETMIEAKREAQKIIENSRLEAVRVKENIIAEAERSAVEMVEKAKLSIKEAERSAINHLKKETVYLSIRIASKLMDDNLDDQKNQTLSEKYLEKLSRL